MITHVLIVHGQLPFAITLKQTLERGAPFEAHPFTSVEAAGEYLRDHVQDVALVDFEIPDFPGDQIVRLLRGIQPNLAIIATPRQDEDTLRDLQLQASIKGGFAARDLISLINAYYTDHQRPTFVPPQNTTGLLGRLQTREQPSVKPPPTPPQPQPTRDLSQENPSGTRDLNLQNLSGTRDLSGHTPLDSVLSREGGATNILGEPPIAPGDTPANIIEDLAWAHEQPKPDSSFDDVLNALPTDASGETAPRNPFTDLVNSMRSEEAHRPLPSRQEQFVEFILSGGMDSLLEEIEQSQGTSPPPDVTQTSVFERLAMEEPPPPTFEESGTISDLVTGVQDRSFRNVLSILRGEDIQDSESIAPPTAADFDVGERQRTERTRAGESFFDDEEPTPARVILQRALEEQVGGDEFSLEELLQSIEEQFPQTGPKILPSPAWLRDEQQSRENAFMVREPDFLPEELPPEPTPSAELYPNQTTQPSREQQQQIEEHPESLETERLEDRQSNAEDTARIPRTLPEEIPADATVMHQPVSPDTAFPSETSQMWHQLPDQDFNTQFELMAAFEVHDEKGMSSGALYTEVPVPEEEVEDQWDDVEPEPPPLTPQPAEPPTVEDPYLAQLALSLTEASLELSAEATLLARDGQIVAFAGRMPKEEVDDLRGAIADDWNAVPGEVRIRFLTARGSGKDYMLYSRRTEDDFTLSLIFAGTTPLRTIRRQGQRLVEALAAVPEPGEAKPETQRTQARTAAQAPVVDTSVRTPYAFVWLLRDPSVRLDSTVSQAITAGLNIQMLEQHWSIQKLQVQNDYIYMLAEVPGEEPAFKLVRDIKRRSAELAHALNPAYNPAALWSDGYLVVTPGRELDAEEIQQFITFERMD